MSITASEYINVQEKIALLNCNYPKGISIIPAGFESAKLASDLRMLAEASTIKKLLKASNIDVDNIAPQKTPFIQNNNHEWMAPTIFYAASLILENPDIISVSLGVIGNYVTDMFKGISKSATVNLSIVVEKPSGKCTKIEYKGSAEGISEVTRLVKEASRD
jgi:hypothetical protein